MPPITLEAIQAKQTELAAMIQLLQKQATQVTQLTLDGYTIGLFPGEHYAGAVLDDEGQHMHHVVLMAETPGKKLPWKDAMDWTTSIGAFLPTRQEMSLLFANCKPHLKPEWHWSCATHEKDASYAWHCHFADGDFSYTHKSFEGGAVAVRRV